MADLLDTNEITSSVKNVLAKRITSPFYGALIITYLLINWEFFYTAFFTSEDKIWEATGQLKHDYLTATFFNYSDWRFWALHVSPFLVTWVIIWILPRAIAIPAFRKDEEYRTETRRIQISEKRKLEIELQGLGKENLKRIDVETTKVEKEKRLEKIDPTIAWEREYDEMKSLSHFNNFQIILDAVYEHHGRIKETGYNEEITFEIPVNTLAFSDANGLVKLNPSENNITLTEKGKFFSKKFLFDSGKDNAIKLEDIPF